MYVRSESAFRKESEKCIEADMVNGLIRLAKMADRYVLVIKPPLRPAEKQRAASLLRTAVANNVLQDHELYTFTVESLGPNPYDRDYNFTQRGSNLEYLLGNRALDPSIVLLAEPEHGVTRPLA